MGIHNLNKFLTSKCSKDSIYKLHLSTLAQKTIVIDISIYIYKFLGQDRLIEHFYLLISVLLHYKITPIFVFDGKPPPEKEGILKQRRKNKKEAKHEYYVLQESIDEDTSEEDKMKIISKMDNLKKEFIRISDVDIQNVKTLLEYYGVDYIEATGEADVVCCNMVVNGEAWACLSDDMDMFLYGCNRVLRFISLLNHNVIMYDTVSILKELNMDLNTFLYFTVPCGTDYNIEANITLNQMMNLFILYKSSSSAIGFDKYLIENGTINDSVYEICDMFCLDKNCVYTDYIYHFTKNTRKLRELLTKFGFIYA